MGFGTSRNLKADKKIQDDFWINLVNKPDLKDYERNEWNLIHRIAGIDEGGNPLEKRVDEARRSFQAQREVSEHYAKQTQGQTEDQYLKEQSRWFGNHKKVVQAAREKFGLKGGE
jgi:hypothetical protein